MSQNANDFYVQIVESLSEAERLRLAALILNDLTNSSENIDFSETWNEEDLQDLYKFSLSHSESPHDLH